MISSNEIDIPYALREGAIVHISQVPRGLNCRCVCARCGSFLVARKGLEREHHFAHHGHSDCPGAAETLLHYLAKEVLSRVEGFAFPEYRYRDTKLRFGNRLFVDRAILAAGRMRVCEAEVERPLGSIVPDLLFRSQDLTKALIVEVAVSHRVDKAKLRIIRRLDLPALELKLTIDHLRLPPGEFTRLLVDDVSIKSWLFHPAQRAVEAEWIATLRGQSRESSRRRFHAVIDSSPNNRVDAAVAKLKLHRHSKASWRIYNDWAEGFKRKNGRYPSLEENRAFSQANREK